MTVIQSSNPVSGIEGSDAVTVSVPSDPSFLGLLRSTSAHVASRLDMTIEEIDDVRMAVDEAANVLLAASVGPTIDLRLALDDELTIVISTQSDGTEPDRDGFAWTVLSALTDTVDASVTAGRLTLTLTKTRLEA